MEFILYLLFLIVPPDLYPVDPPPPPYEDS